MKLRYMLGIALLLGAAYFALFGGEYGLLEVRNIELEQEQESARLEQAIAEVERLQARADSLTRDSATIERVARERWGLIRPGERLYRFEPFDSTKDTVAARIVRPDTARRDTTRDGREPAIDGPGRVR